VTYPGRVALVDRDAIERRDFPVGRRGYDQAAVDAHLRHVADDVEAMRARPAAFSAGASEQVRLILEAAERSAGELRDDAGRRASEHVERVREAAEAMLAGIEGVERELAELLGSLRESGRRLTDGLARLQADVGEVEPPEEAAPTADALPAASAEAPDEPVPVGAEPEADETGARLIALNMALSGTPREETAAYLGEHFTLADAESLLDHVYARAAK
jgi:DivIVA domain-containing protein